MKILIAYASPTGTAEKCAKQLAEMLPGAELHKLAKKGNPDPAKYDMVIVGGSIRGGGLSPAAQMYLEYCEETLLTRKLGLFICCGTDSKSDMYFENNISEALLSHATARACFGGELAPERAHGFIDRMLVKMMAKAEKTEGLELELHMERIPGFAEKMLAQA